MKITKYSEFLTKGPNKMLAGKRIAVVLPAYNASRTLRSTYAEIPHDMVDYILLVDDSSSDDTVEIAKTMQILTHRHEENMGYGANQKTCYRLALQTDADIVVMLHPDYQYTPKLLRAMCAMIAEGVYDVVLGSRILGGGALRGGMPVYKYFSNRVITFLENLFLGAKLSEYHTGYRAYHRSVLESVNWTVFSDDFIFDNQFLIESIVRRFRIGEVYCPTKYFKEASSIRFGRALRYGILCLLYSLQAGIKLLPQRRIFAKAMD